jgi:hypothetical protein
MRNVLQVRGLACMDTMRSVNVEPCSWNLKSLLRQIPALLQYAAAYHPESEAERSDQTLTAAAPLASQRILAHRRQSESSPCLYRPCQEQTLARGL